MRTANFRLELHPGINDHVWTGRRKRRRRGITIIEVIVLMTAVAAMLGLCVIMLRLLMRLDGDSRARLDGAASLSRLSRQFRQDVHASTDAAVAEDPKSGPRLKLQSGPRTIEYQALEGRGISRTEIAGTAVVRREIYAVPKCGPITFDLREENERRLASLAVDRRASANRTDPPRVYETLAVLARDAKLGRLPASVGPGGGKS